VRSPGSAAGNATAGLGGGRRWSLPLAFRIARFFDLTVDKMFDPDDEGTAT
jgi:hypothetical protein